MRVLVIGGTVLTRPHVVRQLHAQGRRNTSLLRATSDRRQVRALLGTRLYSLCQKGSN